MTTDDAIRRWWVNFMAGSKVFLVQRALPIVPFQVENGTLHSAAAGDSPGDIADEPANSSQQDDETVEAAPARQIATDAEPAEVAETGAEPAKTTETRAEPAKTTDTGAEPVEKAETGEALFQKVEMGCQVLAVPRGTEVKDTNVKDTEVKDTEMKDTEVKHTEVKNTEVDTEVKDTEVKDTAVKDTAVKDTAVKDTAVKDIVVKGIVVKGIVAKGTEVKGREMKDTKVKDNDEVATNKGNETTTGAKRMTTKFTETVARSTAACFKPMDFAPQSITSVTPGFSFSADQVPKGIRAPPGFDFLPELAWPVSDRPWPWAAMPRVGPGPPPPPGRTEPAVTCGAIVNPHVQPETADEQLDSKPKGGARRKVRPVKKSKGKSSHTNSPPVEQNGGPVNGTMNGSIQPIPDAVQQTAEPVVIDAGRLCSGRPSPRKLSAAVSAFQKQCAVVHEAEPARERPFIDREPGEYCGPEERGQLRSGVWWRRELQQKVRRRGRVGRWFDRRFERGVVQCDPPPPVKYTGEYSYSSHYSLG